MVTCKMLLRLSKSVSARQDLEIKKGAETTHRTNPAMQFTICYVKFFVLNHLQFHFFYQ